MASHRLVVHPSPFHPPSTDQTPAPHLDWGLVVKERNIQTRPRHTHPHPPTSVSCPALTAWYIDLDILQFLLGFPLSSHQASFLISFFVFCANNSLFLGTKSFVTFDPPPLNTNQLSFLVSKQLNTYRTRYTTNQTKDFKMRTSFALLAAAASVTQVTATVSGPRITSG